MRDDADITAASRMGGELPFAAFATRFRLADEAAAWQICINERTQPKVAHGAAKVRRRLFAGIASVAIGVRPVARATSETASTDL